MCVFGVFVGFCVEVLFGMWFVCILVCEVMWGWKCVVFVVL